MRRILPFILLLIYPLLGVGFAQAKNPTPGGNLVVGIPFDLAPINPFTTASTASANILELIYDPLINLDVNYQMVPILAERWEVSSDQLTWTFYLRKNIKFHDGTSLTAKDVQLTFETLKKIDNNIYTSFVKNLQEINVINSSELSFVLKKPDQAFPQFLRQVYIVPSHLFTLEGVPLSESYYQKPIGSGAFFIDHIDQSQAILKKNANYFLGNPYLDEVDFSVYKNEKILLSNLLSGKVDLEFFYDTKYLQVVQNIPALKIVPYDNQHLFAIFLDMKNPLFQSRQVRQALNEAINKEEIDARLLDHVGEKAVSVVPPSNPYFDGTIKPYQDSKQAAVKLLGEAGWKIDPQSLLLKKSGKPFVFTVLTSQGGSFEENVLAMVREDLSQIGMTLEIKSLPMDEVIQAVFTNKNFDAVIFPYTNFFGISADYFFWHGGNVGSYNFTSYENPQIDQLLEEARYAPTISESRSAYQKYQKVIHDDPPLVYLFWKRFSLVVNKRVHGIQPNPWSLFKELRHVWVDAPAP